MVVIRQNRICSTKICPARCNPCSWTWNLSQRDVEEDTTSSIAAAKKNNEVQVPPSFSSQVVVVVVVVLRCSKILAVGSVSAISSFLSFFPFCLGSSGS